MLFFVILLVTMNVAEKRQDRLICLKIGHNIQFLDKLWRKNMNLVFASDNTGPLAPEILQALTDANDGSAMPYGADVYAPDVKEHIRDLFDAPDADVLLVATGTAANALALAGISAPWETVFCHREAHIAVDECGAPEFYTGGGKLTLLEGDHGKVSPETLSAALTSLGGKSVHTVQPGAVSLTNVTEAGTLYSLNELQELRDIANTADVPAHLDGARFANACAGLGCTAAELGSGFDMISFGGTKNGCLAVEALVIRDPHKTWEMELRRKRAGHLWSKHRFLSAQMLAYLRDDLWLSLAQQANSAAAQLAEGLAKIDEATFIHPPQANMIFARLPRAAHQSAMVQGAKYYLLDGALEGPEDETIGCRLVCDWSKTEADVAGLISAFQAGL